MKYTLIISEKDFHTGSLRKEKDVAKVHLDMGLLCPWICGRYVELDVTAGPPSVVLALMRSGCNKMTNFQGI